MKAVLNRYATWIPLSTACGILAGLSSGIFLIALNWVTETRTIHPFLIYFLPLAGFFSVWLYYRYGQAVSEGSHLILDEIHEPKKIIPFRMAPLVLIGTLLTHLFGGSAGREGTAVQMGASLSSQLGTFFKRITLEDQKTLLILGMGAGFGAAVGAPLAGAFFGMEVLWIGRFRVFALFECLLASFVGYAVSIAIGAQHSVYPALEFPPFQFSTLFFVLIAGVIFGITALVFIKLTHFVETILTKYISYSPFRPLFGGVILIILFKLEGSLRYAGLGIPVIQKALTHPSSFQDPFLKAIFSVLTLGSGFKGGEFIPLVFVGTTLGSALSFIFPISFSLLGAVGFAAVFGAAANTPIACAIMAMELFGWKIGMYAFPACFVAYYCSGHHGIYPGQKISHSKKEILNFFRF